VSSATDPPPATIHPPGREARSPARRADPEDVALFHTSLAALTRGGLPLGRALRLVGADLGRASLARDAEALAVAVDAGTPLDVAYADPARPFPPLYRALVAAGITSGDLPTALDEIAGHARTEADAARRVRGALIHPVVTAVCAVLVGLVALVFTAPRLWGVSEEIGTATRRRSPPSRWESRGARRRRGRLVFRRSPVTGTRGAPLGVGRCARPPRRASRPRSHCCCGARRRCTRRSPSPPAPATNRACVPRARRRRARRGGEGLASALAAERAFDLSVLGSSSRLHGGDGVATALTDVATLLRRRFERGLDRFAAWLRPPPRSSSARRARVRVRVHGAPRPPGERRARALST
jgi:hypothetical protein